ncbi:MAG: MaoC family dehydratase [Halobacteriales archaeon]
MIYYEDLTIGQQDTVGSYEVTESEIVEFAEQYDPQPMHTDPEAAEESMFGGLVASGWHTASMCMRLLVENYLADSAAMGSPGADELRWHEPVRPGDELTVETEVLEKRPSESRPDRGLVRVDVGVRNDEGTLVMSMESLVFWGRREVEDGGGSYTVGQKY